MLLRHLVPWPSVDIHKKFHGDRPRGTPSPGGVKHNWGSQYNDLGPISKVYRKRCNIGGKLVLITNRKSYELSTATKIGDLE